MGKIIISTNMTLDGITQDPTGEEGFAFGGWFEAMSPADREAWGKVEYEESVACSAYLLGGRTYAWFAPKWVNREGAWGERLMELPKYVVRSQAGRTDWGPTFEINGDVLDEVRTLKDSIDGEILVYGSYELGHLLVENDLVDEVRLFLFPQVIGSGRRVFTDLTQSKPMQIVSAERVGDNLAQVVYRFDH